MRVSWRPEECRAGDIVRVRLGAVYHYGVFVSESEIIQFGLPPLPKYRDVTPVCVLATDMGVFSCGQIVERAVFGFPDCLRRRPAEKAVALARSRLGEQGYNIIHNNCEHFAFECVLGVRYCAEEEEARRRWSERPICDVYIAMIGADTDPAGLCPPERAREILDCENESVRAARLAVWRLMQFGVRRSMSRDPDALPYRRTRAGKWVCGDVYISLAHSENLAVAAISDRPVGVDIEETASFSERRGADLDALRGKALTPKELALAPAADPALDFLRLWTRKESLFKRKGKGRFSPRSIEAADADTRSRLLTEPVRAVVSVSGGTPRFYWFDGERAGLLGGRRLEEI